MQADVVERADRSRRTLSTSACSSPRRSSAARSPSQPDRVVESVRGALRGIVERERITILVSPDDLEHRARRDRGASSARSAASSTARSRPSAASAAAAASCARPTATSTPASRPSFSARARSSRPRWRTARDPRPRRPGRRRAARVRPASPPRPRHRPDRPDRRGHRPGGRGRRGVHASRPAAGAPPCPPRSSASAPAARC